MVQGQQWNSAVCRELYGTGSTLEQCYHMMFVGVCVCVIWYRVNICGQRLFVVVVCQNKFHTVICGLDIH